MPSPQEQAFLQAIVEAPDDDTPRLVYADWLEEHGDADRAEFIRLQCRLAEMGEADPAREELVEREQQLLGLHGRRWSAALPRLVRHEEHEVRRGFVSHLNLTASAFLRRADRLFSLAPVNSVWLTRVLGRTDELARCPTLGRLSALELPHCGLNASVLRRLLGSPHLTRLRSLELSGNPLRPEGAQELAAWPGLARLSYLGLASTDVRDEGLRAVLESPCLGRLDGLDLSELSLTREAGVLLARCERLAGLRRLVVRKGTLNDLRLADALSGPSLRSLESLDLSSGFLREPGLEVLARAPQLRNLRELALRNCHRGPGGVRAPAPARLDRLAVLDVSEWEMADEGLVALAGAARLPGLRRLGLFFNRLTDEGIIRLAGAAGLPGLAHLELGSNAVGVAGVEALLGSPNLPGLCDLGLFGNRPLADDLPRLAAVPGLRRLRRVSLNNVGAAGEPLAAFVQSPYPAGLTCLDLGNNQVDNRVAAAVAASPALAGLAELHLYVGRMDGEGVRALARSPHLRRLRVLDVGYHAALGRDAVDELLASPNLGQFLRLRVSVGSPSDLGRLRRRFGERVIGT